MKLADRFPSFKRIIRRVRSNAIGPMISETAIKKSLAALPRGESSAVLIHSSLSSAGYIIGGAKSVIRAIKSTFAGFTICFPTHTYCYPCNDGSCEVFDRSKTPSRVGAITNEFLREREHLRSLHPTHSLAAIGPVAQYFTSDHEECDTPCGRGTPYEKLIAQDCAVLMFCTTLNAYTLFHTAEDAANVSYLYEPTPYSLRYRNCDGLEVPYKMRRQDMGVPRRFSEMADWMESEGLLFRRALGRSQILWIPSSRKAHLALLSELKTNPRFLIRS